MAAVLPALSLILLVEGAVTGPFRAGSRTSGAGWQIRLSIPADVDCGSTASVCALLNAPDKTSRFSEDDWTNLYSAAARDGALLGFGVLSPGMPRSMSVQQLEVQTGLPVASLTPRNANLSWGLVGILLFLVEMGLARAFGAASGVAEALPLAVIGILIDQLVLGSTITLAVARAVMPNLGERLARHEAGHFLLSYFYGLPVTGYFLAGRLFTVGQAGTVFLYPEIQEELAKGELRQSSLARYATILMGGIAAEAINFGNAEGGFADERTLVALLLSLRPRWDDEKVFNLARWSIASAVSTLREFDAAHGALTEAMKAGAPLGDCVACIEAEMPCLKS